VFPAVAYSAVALFDSKGQCGPWILIGVFPGYSIAHWVNFSTQSFESQKIKMIFLFDPFKWLDSDKKYFYVSIVF
jgi:hypothetical protein